MANDSPFSFGGGGNTSPSSLLDRAEGKSLRSIWKQGLGAWLLTVSTSAILGLQAVVELFVLTPIDILTGIMQASAQAIVREPLGVVSAGAQQSADALSTTYILGLPLSVILVLGTFMIVALFLRQPATSDTFPGTFTDFIGGTDEEDEE